MLSYSCRIYHYPDKWNRPSQPCVCFFDMHINTIVLNLSPNSCLVLPPSIFKIWAVSPVYVWLQSAQGILYTTFFSWFILSWVWHCKSNQKKHCRFLNTTLTPICQIFLAISLNILIHKVCRSDHLFFLSLHPWHHHCCSSPLDRMSTQSCQLLLSDNH